MSLSLLELVQTACYELGLPPPSSVIGNSDAQVQQLLALSNREGREQASLPEGWSQLRKEYTFTTVDGDATYAFPTDCEYIIHDTSWSRTNKWPNVGPMNPQEWQWLKSGITVAAPPTRYRFMDGQIYLDPTPSSAEDMVFEYYSNAWCESSGGTPQTKWAADSDVFVLPDDIMILGIKWRFLSAKGMNYAEEKNAWQQCVDKAVSRSRGARELPLNGSAWPGAPLIGINNIPDGSWNV
jgi:hypothetical protein